MAIAPTPKDTILRDGVASLYRFRRSESGQQKAAPVPVLLVPSLINRWYVLDLSERASLAGAFVKEGFDTWCLDWGIPEDEDRYSTWDDAVARLHRMIRAVQRRTGSKQVALLGYCVGATLSGIATALEPDTVAAFINLAGPFDFRHTGFLGQLADARWFDAKAVADAGNVAPQQMQAGFQLLHPMLAISKWVNFADRAHDPVFRAGFETMETWAGDNIPFPAAAYQTYITELYQENRLIAGGHHVQGREVALSNIRCPVLTVVTERDTICPPPAAEALNHRVSGPHELLRVPGGHVGAVAGSKSASTLYPQLTRWMRSKTCN